MGYKPIGGVLGATLYAADTVDSMPMGVDIELIDDSSSYIEEICVERGSAVVRHTLTLKALYSNAEDWLSSEFIDMATYCGVVAEVTLNDSRQITIGHSETLQLEQPMRIKSLVIDSARSVAETPTVTLVLYSEDVAII